MKIGCQSYCTRFCIKYFLFALVLRKTNLNEFWDLIYVDKCLNGFCGLCTFSLLLQLLITG